MTQVLSDFIKVQDDGTAILKINKVGAVTGETYIGSFKVHCVLTAHQILNAGRGYRNYLGNSIAFAEKYESDLAFSLSQLEQRVISAPAFWQSGNIRDLEVVLHVADLAMEAESIFRNKQKSEAEEALKIIKKNMQSFVSAGKSKKKKTRKSADILGAGEMDSEEDVVLDEESEVSDE